MNPWFSIVPEFYAFWHGPAQQHTNRTGWNLIHCRRLNIIWIHFHLKTISWKYFKASNTETGSNLKEKKKKNDRSPMSVHTRLRCFSKAPCNNLLSFSHWSIMWPNLIDSSSWSHNRSTEVYGNQIENGFLRRTISVGFWRKKKKKAKFLQDSDNSTSFIWLYSKDTQGECFVFILQARNNQHIPKNHQIHPSQCKEYHHTVKHIHNSDAFPWKNMWQIIIPMFHILQTVVCKVFSIPKTNFST